MNQPKCIPVTNCGLCGSQNLLQVLDFGEMPNANSFLRVGDGPNPSFPLSVVYCTKCNCNQLGYFVSGEYLYSDYIYNSRESGDLCQHLECFVADVLKIIPHPKKALDIGSNSGPTLQAFKKHSIGCFVGVEPCEKLANIANADGLNTKVDFFTHKLALKLKEEYGVFDLITATNSFAHVRNIRDVLDGIKELLSSGGVFVFEVAYLLDTIANKDIGQYYLDHEYQHHITPLKTFFEENLLEIFKIERLPTQNGSIRVYVKKMGNNIYNVGNEVNWMIDFERQNFSIKTMFRFKEEVLDLKDRVAKFFADCKNKKKTVCAFGAAAKYNTLAHVLGFQNIEYVVDNARNKTGLLTPDGKTKIVSSNYFENSPCDFCIITATNFADLIMKKNSNYRGNWVRLCPEFEIIK